MVVLTEQMSSPAEGNRARNSAPSLRALGSAYDLEMILEHAVFHCCATPATRAPVAVVRQNQAPHCGVFLPARSRFGIHADSSRGEMLAQRHAPSWPGYKKNLVSEKLSNLRCHRITMV
jgi:hypothetical protein